jgi:hypothetical protein
VFPIPAKDDDRKPEKQWSVSVVREEGPLARGTCFR